jgi:putative glutamine amidotransferase
MSREANHKPRVGIPYRARNEEVSGDRTAYDKYVTAVRQAGGEPIEISLRLAPAQLDATIRGLDAIVLPGSPADVHPSLFKATPHPNCSISDPRREATDFALLKHALASPVPLLAICYGIQSLNVFLGGTLIQDIASQVQSSVQHAWPGHQGEEPHHEVRFDPESRLAQLAGTLEASVNSSHHQSVLNPGRPLRVVARAPDGVIEAVEWTESANWVTGVQWHPERMVESDRLAQALFRSLVAAARRAPVPT